MSYLVATKCVLASLHIELSLELKLKSIIN
jgi:hypothetical protein